MTRGRLEDRSVRVERQDEKVAGEIATEACVRYCIDVEVKFKIYTCTLKG